MPGLIEVHLHARHFSTTATHFVGITATFEGKLEVLIERRELSAVVRICLKVSTGEVAQVERTNGSEST